MKKLTATVAALLISGPAFSAAHEIDQDVVDGILAKLKVMKCQMDPDDIEAEDGGYELDDVICEGGQQMDIELDAELNEVGRRLE